MSAYKFAFLAILSIVFITCTKEEVDRFQKTDSAFAALVWDCPEVKQNQNLFSAQINGTDFCYADSTDGVYFRFTDGVTYRTAGSTLHICDTCTQTAMRVVGFMPMEQEFILGKEWLEILTPLFPSNQDPVIYMDSLFRTTKEFPIRSSDTSNIGISIEFFVPYPSHTNSWSTTQGMQATLGRLISANGDQSGSFFRIIHYELVEEQGLQCVEIEAEMKCNLYYSISERKAGELYGTLENARLKGKIRYF